MLHPLRTEAYELFGVVGDRKRQGMSLHAKALACLNEKNTPGAVENALEALSIYRDIGISAGGFRWLWEDQLVESERPIWAVCGGRTVLW